jgi:hypothetical protein
MTDEPKTPKQLSILNLLKLLDDIALREEEELYEFLSLKALGSQGALAKLELTDREIMGMSLNTCKRVAEDCLVGGFERLDNARRRALEVLEHRRSSAAKSGRLTKVGAKVARDEAKGLAKLLRGDLTHITRALQYAVSRMRDYAEGRPELQARLRNDLREVYARASAARTGIRLVGGE